jgi:uncharacterized membrane protein
MQFISPVAVMVLGLVVFVWTYLVLQRQTRRQASGGAGAKNTGARATLIMANFVGVIIFVYGLIRLIVVLMR